MTPLKVNLNSNNVALGGRAGGVAREVRGDGCKCEGRGMRCVTHGGGVGGVGGWGVGGLGRVTFDSLSGDQ